MATRSRLFWSRIAFGASLIVAVMVATSFGLAAQTPVAASMPASSQRGTVKAISGSTITMAADGGQAVTVNVANAAKIVQLAVGSTDLKTATASQMTEISVGDRVLVTGKAGDTPDTFNAVRVIVMKSADIAQKQASDQADWKARGTGGIVSSVDSSTGAITLTVGARKVVVNTSSKTDFRRFARDSVKYQDARPGTMAQIQPKDEMQARGTLSADGASMQADEVISGSFENLSGLITSVDAASGKITLRDLATKKVMTVDVTAKSDVRAMPLPMATMFAARSSAGAQGGGRKTGSGGGQAGTVDAGGAGGGRRSAGADLAQMITRLPTSTLADLHKGDAVMIVASETPSGSTVTAVTVLTGVDPILTANPNGGMDLSMSVSGGASSE